MGRGLAVWLIAQWLLAIIIVIAATHWDVSIALVVGGTAALNTGLLVVGLRGAARPAADIAPQPDVDSRLRAEAELRQAQKLESVGRLAAGIAHEINTPIQFVTDSLHFLRDATVEMQDVVDKLRAGAISDGDDADLTDLSRRIPRAVDRSLDGVARVANIVRSLKTFAHPDSSEPAVVDLNAAIESTLVIARTEYKYVADVVTELPPLPHVRCFIGDINQAVLNIIVNAAHAIGEVVEGTEQRGTIVVKTECAGGDVVVSVSDTGAGIPDTIRDRIFDPFFTTKPVGKGTGQGLAIAHAVIVHKHGGSIAVESRLGEGTTFRLRFPVAGPGALGAAA